MRIQAAIETKLRVALDPRHLEVINESHLHNVPAGSESHFKVVAVSSSFEHKSLVSRHRQIFHLLDDELKAGVHALAMHLYTPLEWSKANDAGAAAVAGSPPCLGGSKAE